MRLNLGSGIAWLAPTDGWIDVDKMVVPGRESFTCICDLDVMPWPWADDSCEEIRASHIIEHCADKMRFLHEMWRVSVHGARVHVCAPNCLGNPDYWHDPSHRWPMHPGNMEYFHPNHRYACYSRARFITVQVGHTGWQLDWELIAYKREDSELSARQVDWRDSRWWEKVLA